jgi:hypothetical protein
MVDAYATPLGAIISDAAVTKASSLYLSRESEKTPPITQWSV